MNFWNDENTAEMKRLWNDGHSDSEIARALGAASRNVVVGRRFRTMDPAVDRVRLRKPKLNRPQRARPKQRTRPEPVFPLLPCEPLPEPDVIDHLIPYGQRRTIFELTSETCRWPIGEGADLFFCGGPSAEGRPYCGRHCRIAYRRGGQCSRAESALKGLMDKRRRAASLIAAVLG